MMASHARERSCNDNISLESVPHRNAMQVTPPCVPFLGMHLTDLTFIDDGSKTYLSDGVINFERCRRVANSIGEIERLTEFNYQFEVVPAIREWLDNIDGAPDEISYQWSLMYEPKVNKQGSDSFQVRFGREGGGGWQRQ